MGLIKNLIKTILKKSWEWLTLFNDSTKINIDFYYHL